MKKRGSLELSVNAIVIFIIAFAMLGVGLFFVNKVRNSIDIDPKDFIPADQMKNPPSSERPLTIEDIKIKKNQKIKVNIGFYAKQSGINALQFFVIECVNADNQMRIARAVADGTNALTLAPTCTTPDATTAPCPAAGEEKLPTITSAYSQILTEGEGIGIPVYFNGNNAFEPNSNHICTLGAVTPVAAGSPDYKVIETTQFSLEIQG